MGTLDYTNPIRLSKHCYGGPLTTGLFMDTTFTKEKGFKMEKLKNLLLVKNVDGTVNIGGAITHQVKCNMFFKGHVERVRIDVCNLGKTEVILGMP